jgi:alanine racemase
VPVPPVRPLRAQARVDLAAVTANTSALARRAAGGAALMAVVKAEGYGHGMVESARAALAGGATWLGVAALDEALALRDAGLTAPVLAWLTVPGEALAEAVARRVDLSVGACWQLEETVAAAREAGSHARVHLKVDTGLGRGGATAADWPDLLGAVARAQAEGVVEVVGVWSHFAFADEPGSPVIARQVEGFRDAVAAAERSGVRPQLRHLANSAASLTLPEAHFDLVRPGLALYGLSPVPQVGGPEAFGLRPAMTLSTRLALAKRVPAGTAVSYGHRYTTSRETTLGLVPLGYADGIPRAGTNRAPLWVGGARRTVAGTVCMDQVVVDLGDDPVAAGDEVVLFGPGECGEPTAQDWAEATGTISYEIVTRVGARVPRVFTGAPDRATAGVAVPGGAA